jgi:hypothetical protein
MARTMLDEFSTPRKFWDEAISTACYVSNRVLLRLKIGKTSYELRFEHRPSVSHFRVFGCKCFVLKSGNLDKFEATSTNGIFLGYSAPSCGYRVFVLDTNKIIETCEVTFDETSPGTSPSVVGTSADVQGESIFVDEDGEDNENDILVPSTQPVVAPPTHTTTSPTTEHPQASTSSVHIESQGEGEVSEATAPLHI